MLRELFVYLKLGLVLTFVYLAILVGALGLFLPLAVIGYGGYQLLNWVF